MAEFGGTLDDVHGSHCPKIQKLTKSFGDQVHFKDQLIKHHALTHLIE